MLCLAVSSAGRRSQAKPHTHVTDVQDGRGSRHFVEGPQDEHWDAIAS